MAATLTRRRLTEYADNRGVALHVDRDKSVIHGVKVLGLNSKNGRTYASEAVAQAASLYEGKAVNVDHPPRGKGNEARSYASRIGHLEGIQVKPDGLYGDLHFNPKHQLAEQLAYDAEHAPHRVGLSHNVEGKTSAKNGKLVVEAITSVASVDIVADPATTNSLYEAEGDMPDDSMPAEPTGADPVAAILDTIGDKIVEIAKSDADLSTKKAQITDLLKKQDKIKTMLSDEKAPSAPADDKPADDAPKTEAMERKIAALEEQLAARDKRDAVNKLIAEAKLPERLVTPILTKSLLEAKDDAERKAILEERTALAREIAGRPRSVDPNGRSETKQVTEATVRKSLMEAIA